MKKQRDMLLAALKWIERFGHNEGHGSGYTCANVAQRYIDKVENQK